MVASKQEEVLLEFDFVGQQQNNCLEGLLAAVNVIAKEEVVRFRRVPSILKQPEQVGELAVNVTCTR